MASSQCIEIDSDNLNSSDMGDRSDDAAAVAKPPQFCITTTNHYLEKQDLPHE